jgi:hypothetical protein
MLTKVRFPRVILTGDAEQLGPDVDRFGDELERHRMRNRIADDVTHTPPAHARHSPPSDQAASDGLVLVGEVGGRETFERHPERASLDDPSANVG